MKKYAINEYSIDGYKELVQIKELLMRLKELGDIEFFNLQCKNAMDIAREWIGTENALCFAEYDKDNIVIVEFGFKPVNDTFQYAESDENGIYIEID